MVMIYYAFGFVVRGIVYVFSVLVLIVVIVSARFYFSKKARYLLRNSKLYVGHVNHSRLKGGATHSFQYPLFFSFIDLEEVQSIGWSLWPIFKHNGGWSAFCSLGFYNTDNYATLSLIIIIIIINSITIV